MKHCRKRRRGHRLGHGRCSLCYDGTDFFSGDAGKEIEASCHSAICHSRDNMFIAAATAAKINSSRLFLLSVESGMRKRSALGGLVPPGKLPAMSTMMRRSIFVHDLEQEGCGLSAEARKTGSPGSAPKIQRAAAARRGRFLARILSGREVRVTRSCVERTTALFNHVFPVRARCQAFVK